MVYKLFDSPDGEYQDKATGERKSLLEANVASTPLGDNVGWVEFENIDQAMLYFNVELIIETK